MATAVAPVRVACNKGDQKQAGKKCICATHSNHDGQVPEEWGTHLQEQEANRFLLLSRRITRNAEAKMKTLATKRSLFFVGFLFVLSGNSFITHAGKAIPVRAESPAELMSVDCGENADPYAPGSPCKITADISYSGERGEGFYQIFLGDDNVLDRPIIVTDGFDPSTSRPGGSRRIGSIYDFVDKPDSNPLVERLRSAGFDIVILDFDHGADYIQRNAFVLVKLINMVNGMKSGNDKLVVVGPSMGGLVVRYALAYMEEESMQHGVGLHVSFDTPHRGANIPLAAQMWVRDSYGVGPFPLFNVLFLAVDVLNTPAAKQMLLAHHLSSFTGSTQLNPSPHALHASFYNELRDLNDDVGYPCKPINASVINGSIGVITGTNGSSRYGRPQREVDGGYVLPGANAISLTAGATSVQQSSLPWSEVEYGGDPVIVYSRYNPLADFPNSQLTAPPGPGYDSAPGGYSNIWEQLDEQLSNAGQSTVLRVGNSSFIPTVSALDYETDDLFYPVGDESNLLSEIPFDIYYAPTGENQFHASVPSATANWIYDLITDQPDPDLACKLPGGRPPDPPSNISVAGSPGNYPRVEWSASPSSNVDYYELHGRSVPYGSWSRVASTSATSYVDSRFTIGSIGDYDNRYEYKVRAVNDDGLTSIFSDVVWIYSRDEQPYSNELAQSPTALEPAHLPTEFALEGSYPNPTSDRTLIHYALPESAYIELVVYDALGREVARLVDREVSAGYHQATLDASGLSSGVYIYRMRTGGAYAESRKLVVMR